MKDSDFYIMQQNFSNNDVHEACALFPKLSMTNQQAWCVFAAQNSNPDFLKFALQQEIAPSMSDGMLIHLYKNRGRDQEMVARNTKMILDLFSNQIKYSTRDHMLETIMMDNNYAALKAMNEFFKDIDRKFAFATQAAEYGSLEVLQVLWPSLDDNIKDNCLSKCVTRQRTGQVRTLKWLAPRTDVRMDDCFALRHSAFNRNKEAFNALLPYCDITAKKSESLYLWINANEIDMVDRLFEYSNGQDVEDRLIHYGTDNEASKYFMELWTAKKERDLMLSSITEPKRAASKSKM